MSDYKLYQSNVIDDSFVRECEKVKSYFFADSDSTWTFEKYNIFSLTSSSVLFYDLYKELNYLIRDYCNSSHRLWMQSWINFHSHNEVLDWHNHPWDFHGYICVDPKQSITEFRDWKIENKQGQIYIGPGDAEHRVIAQPYDGLRITIGFDCSFKENSDFSNLSMVPVL